MKSDKFYKKKWSEGGQIAKREILLNRLAKSLKDKPLFASTKEEGRFNASRVGIYTREEWGYFGSQSIISLKTGYGLRYKCGVEINTGIEEIPYWGNINEIKNKLHES